jgi:hypothetical protein
VSPGKGGRPDDATGYYHTRQGVAGSRRGHDRADRPPPIAPTDRPRSRASLSRPLAETLVSRSTLRGGSEHATSVAASASRSVRIGKSRRGTGSRRIKPPLERDGHRSPTLLNTSRNNAGYTGVLRGTQMHGESGAQRSDQHFRFAFTRRRSGVRGPQRPPIYPRLRAARLGGCPRCCHSWRSEASTRAGKDRGIRSARTAVVDVTTWHSVARLDLPVLTDGHADQPRRLADPKSSRLRPRRIIDAASDARRDCGNKRIPAIPAALSASVRLRPTES